MIFFWNTILTSICRPLIDEFGSFNMSDDTIHGAGLSPEQYRSLKNSSKIHRGWNSTLHFLQHSIQTINPLLLLIWYFGCLLIFLIYWHERSWPSLVWIHFTLLIYLYQYACLYTFFYNYYDWFVRTKLPNAYVKYLQKSWKKNYPILGEICLSESSCFFTSTPLKCHASRDACRNMLKVTLCLCLQVY